MANGAIHRVIEQQAAMQPDAVAIVDGTSVVRYRELNQRANTLARRLGACGLTRGSVALVRMERCVDLATVLLAVLKAGAAYAWIEPGSREDVGIPGNFAIARKASATEQCYQAVDIRHALAACNRPSSNLPILTRGSEIACVLPAIDGTPEVLVPHETVTSMPAMAPTGQWLGEAGAFDLWIGLMSGETLALREHLPTTTQAA